MAGPWLVPVLSLRPCDKEKATRADSTLLVNFCLFSFVSTRPPRSAPPRPATQIIAEAILVTYEMFGRKRSGATTNGTRRGGGGGVSRSPTRELKLPLPRSSRSSSAFALEAAEEEEEKEAEFETFAEFQRRQAEVQAQPVPSSIPAFYGSSAGNGERPPPPRYQARQPASPPARVGSEGYPRK